MLNTFGKTGLFTQAVPMGQSKHFSTHTKDVFVKPELGSNLYNLGAIVANKKFVNPNFVNKGEPQNRTPGMILEKCSRFITNSNAYPNNPRKDHTFQRVEGLSNQRVEDRTIQRVEDHTNQIVEAPLVQQVKDTTVEDMNETKQISEAMIPEKSTPIKINSRKQTHKKYNKKPKTRVAWHKHSFSMEVFDIDEIGIDACNDSNYINTKNETAPTCETSALFNEYIIEHCDYKPTLNDFITLTKSPIQKSQTKLSPPALHLSMQKASSSQNPTCPLQKSSPIQKSPPIQSKKSSPIQCLGNKLTSEIYKVLKGSPICIKISTPVYFSISPPGNKMCHKRLPSDCTSEDDYVIFDRSDDEEDEDDGDESSDDESASGDESDLDFVEENFANKTDEDNDSRNNKKVRFAPAKDLVEIHPMYAWAFAYQACRKGHWEEYARDRERFKRRIETCSEEISKILDANHRLNVFKNRFLTNESGI